MFNLLPYIYNHVKFFARDKCSTNFITFDCKVIVWYFVIAYATRVHDIVVRKWGSVTARYFEIWV